VALENLLDKPLSTLDTVAIDTPALAATVAMEMDALWAGALGVLGGSLGVINVWRLRDFEYCRALRGYARM
jgi:hypothetical protein